MAVCGGGVPMCEEEVRLQATTSSNEASPDDE